MLTTNVALVFFFLLSCHSYLVQAQIPRVCAHNVTQPHKVCCPIAPQNRLVCGGPERGECEPLITFREPIQKIFDVDDRVQWPRRFFHHLCQCKDNFFGVSCEDCKYGWKGKDCSEKVVYIRRNIKSFSAKEKHFFQKLIVRTDQIESDYLLLVEKDVYHSDPLKDPQFIPTTLHKYLVAMHRYTSRATLFDNPALCAADGYLDYNHGVAMFSLWHRYFMMIWERYLRRIAAVEFGVENFAIPYWDWIDATTCEVCTNDLVGAPGVYIPDKDIRLLSQDSVFYNWTEYCQSPSRQKYGKCVGCHFLKHFQPLNRNFKATEFPTSRELEFIMSKEDFFVSDEGDQCLSFHKAFEGFCGPEGEKSSYLWMHNKVHNMDQGSFCCAATAANDPLFIMHHSQVDRILQSWLNIYRPDAQTALPTEGVKPGQFRDSNMVSFIPVLKNRDVFVDSRELGFDYDNYDFGVHGLSFDKYRP